MRRIHVSQGHESSISLEVFLKSFLLLSPNEREKFKLYCYKSSLIQSLDFLNVDYKITQNSLKIRTIALDLKLLREGHYSESYSALVAAESALAKGDILFTLPTSKGSLSNDIIQYSGHTDYFRAQYKEHCPVMLFSSGQIKMALLTEHIPLTEIANKISEDLVSKKIETLVRAPFSFKRFIFSGINPHAGENGLIGKDDQRLKIIIAKLSKLYKDIDFIGPISGDTLFTNTQAVKEGDCLIAASHDQGLAPFKALFGFRASNITVGLPFLRFSPDHGTAFELYGKNLANYMGTFFTMKESLRYLRSLSSKDA